MPSRLLTAPMLIVLASAPAVAQVPQKAVTAQAFLTERATLNSLGFEWRIAGDDRPKQQGKAMLPSSREAAPRRIPPFVEVEHCANLR